MIFHYDFDFISWGRGFKSRWSDFMGFLPTSFSVVDQSAVLQGINSR